MPRKYKTRKTQKTKKRRPPTDRTVLVFKANARAKPRVVEKLTNTEVISRYGSAPQQRPLGHGLYLAKKKGLKLRILKRVSTCR